MNKISFFSHCDGAPNSLVPQIAETVVKVEDICFFF